MLLNFSILFLSIFFLAFKGEVHGADVAFVVGEAEFDEVEDFLKAQITNLCYGS
jgi:hypothetical protein